MSTLLTRFRLVSAVALTSLGAFGAVACGAEDPTSPEAGDLENTGEVGLDLDIGDDVTVNTVSAGRIELGA